MTDLEQAVFNGAAGVLAQQAEQAMQRARVFTVVAVASGEDLARAGELLLALKAMATEVEDHRKSLKQPILEAGRGIDAAFKPVIAYLESVEGGIKANMSAFHRAEQRRIQAQEAKAAEEQRAALELALEATLKGDLDTAEQLQSEAMTAGNVVSMPAAQMPAGVHTKTVWKCRVTNLHAFVAAVAANPQGLLQYIEVNQRALDSLAASQQGSLNIPGLLAVSEQQIAAKRR